MAGKVYFCPTPIGNLEDITLRALRVMKEADLILAEGIDCVVECGPGTVLSGFMRKIDKTVSSYHAEDIETIQNTVNALKGEK